jgi:hypothetical protein
MTPPVSFEVRLALLLLAIGTAIATPIAAAVAILRWWTEDGDMG